MTKLKPAEVVQLAQAMVDYNYSISELSRNFMVSRSTIWRSLTSNLRYDDDDLFVQCKNILRRHKKDGWMKRSKRNLRRCR